MFANAPGGAVSTDASSVNSLAPSLDETDSISNRLISHGSSELSIGPHKPMLNANGLSDSASSQTMANNQQAALMQAYMNHQQGAMANGLHKNPQSQGGGTLPNQGPLISPNLAALQQAQAQVQQAQQQARQFQMDQAQAQRAAVAQMMRQQQMHQSPPLYSSVGGGVMNPPPNAAAAILAQSAATQNMAHHNAALINAAAQHGALSSLPMNPNPTGVNGYHPMAGMGLWFEIFTRTNSGVCRPRVARY